MLIINTGGTFNKRYNPLTGELYVPEDNDAIHSIVSTFATSVLIEGLLYKDSLEMTQADREILGQCIVDRNEKTILIIHGTDTMDLSAQYVASLGLEKTVIFTGAMVPYSIDKVEATANLAMAMGYAHHAATGVYIVMQGIAGEYTNVKKNRELGKFEYV